MKDLKKILKVAWPVCIGYIALGAPCGILAQKAGMTLFQTIGLCLILYAGSGQFIGIGMMMQSASALSIGLTVFMVNLRHILFSATLQKFVGKKSLPFLSYYAYEVTDESFAVNLTAFENGDWTPEQAMKVNIICHATWTLSNALGYIGGEFIPIDVNLVSYTLTSMFIGLWSFYLSERVMLITGIAAGILSVLLSQYIGYKMHVVLSSVLASSLFAYYTYFKTKRA